MSWDIQVLTKKRRKKSQDPAPILTLEHIHRFKKYLLHMTKIKNLQGFESKGQTNIQHKTQAELCRIKTMIFFHTIKPDNVKSNTVYLSVCRTTNSGQQKQGIIFMMRVFFMYPRIPSHIQHCAAFKMKWWNRCVGLLKFQLCVCKGKTS